MTAFHKTADLVDAHDAEVELCHLPFRRHGRARGFFGRIRTVDVFEDNALVRRALEQPGEGCVLVVDGKGSTKRALVGDQLAALAVKNGWAGILVNGAIRDVVEIADMDFAVFALGTSPKKSAKAGAGAIDVPVSFGGVTLTPGHFLYADDDGVLVAARAVHEPG